MRAKARAEFILMLTPTAPVFTRAGRAAGKLHRV
jgi:hypothetical protein